MSQPPPSPVLSFLHEEDGAPSHPVLSFYYDELLFRGWLCPLLAALLYVLVESRIDLGRFLWRYLLPILIGVLTVLSATLWTCYRTQRQSRSSKFISFAQGAILAVAALVSGLSFGERSMAYHSLLWTSIVLSVMPVFISGMIRMVMMGWVLTQRREKTMWLVGAAVITLYHLRWGDL